MATLKSSEHRTATSTNILCFTRGGNNRKIIEIVPLLEEVGYQYIDLNFCEMMNPHHDIDEKYIGILDRYRRELGVTYTQCHVPYSHDYLSMSRAEQQHLDEQITSAFSYAGTLGVDTVVIHPIKAGVDENIAYFERMIPYLPSSCRLAIENMDREDEISTAEELIAITDHFDKRVGICLDTGHAYLRGLDLASEIRKMGHRLIATHIADNRGKYDEHAMPFFGSIPWEDVMSAMREIGYKGFFTYEIMYFFRFLPQELQMDMVKYSLQVARKLEDLFFKV